MKRFGLFLIIGSASLALFCGALNFASAQEAPPMDDAHIERIRANCTYAKSALNRVYESDGLLRVNRGQLYESVSTRLMTNLNSRIILNRLDGVELISITNSYERALTDFRTNYQQYEQQLSQAISIDCTKQPVAFYDAVTSARQKRTAVYDSVASLNGQASKYKDAFEKFATQYKAAAATVSAATQGGAR